MSRKRLTWKDRQASPPPATPGYEEYWNEDPHPAAKPDAGAEDYLIGDGTPSTFAEDVHPGPYENSAPPAMPTEDGDHPATKRANDEKLLRSLERKANKCIKIAEYTLGPYAPESVVEDHALALMELPNDHIDTTVNTILAAEEEEEEVEVEEEEKEAKKAAEDREAEAMLREMMAEDEEDEEGKEAFSRLAADLQAQLAELRGDVVALRSAMEPEVVDEEEMMLESMLQEEAAKSCQGCGRPMSMEEESFGQGGGNVAQDEEEAMLREMQMEMGEEPYLEPEAPLEEDLDVEEQMMLDEMMNEAEDMDQDGIDQNDAEYGYTGQEMEETEAMLQEMLAESERQESSVQNLLAEDQDEEADEDSDKESAKKEEAEEEPEKEASEIIMADDPMGLMDDGSGNNLTAEDSDLLGQLFSDKLAADDDDDEEEEEEEPEEETEEEPEEETEEVEEEEEVEEKEAKKKKKATSKPKPKPRRTNPQVTSIGQMRTASSGNKEIDELSRLWATDPDVSDVFKS